jgi:hypothetical protein
MLHMAKGSLEQQQRRILLGEPDLLLFPQLSHNQDVLK